MTFGTAQTIVVCIPGAGVQGPCPDGHIQSVTQGYVIAQSDSISIEQALQPLSPEVAGGFFMFGFTTTLVFGLFCFKAGEILALITRHFR